MSKHNDIEIDIDMNEVRPLRIIQVFNRYLHPGGEEKSVARIAQDLESGGHTVERFWRASEEWRQPGAPSKLKQALWLWKNPQVLGELEALQRKTKADAWLLHNVIPVVSLGIYQRARQLGVPIIQWLHNYRPVSVSGTLFAGNKLLTPEDRFGNIKECIAGSWNGRLMTLWLTCAYSWTRRRGHFQSVKAWVAVSDEMKEIFRRGGWYPSQLHSVRHSWHANFKSPEPDANRRGHFLFLGRMVETKGVQFIVDVFSDPSLSHLQLVMAGQGPLADALRDKTPKNIHWVGHIEGEQKRKLVAGCRAIVFPCLWAEPLSTVAYEAYEQGKPIVASNLGGMKEIIEDQVTGRKLPAGDLQAWRKAVLDLSEAESVRMGTAGQSWLSEHVTPQVWVKQFNQIVYPALASAARERM